MSKDFYPKLNPYLYNQPNMVNGMNMDAREWNGNGMDINKNLYNEEF